jgi:hypothetical protein
MDTKIPSSAFLTIGRQLILKSPKSIPVVIQTPDDDGSIGDILSEWATSIIDYFGEHIQLFM